MLETAEHFLPLLTGGTQVVIIIGAVLMGMKIYANAMEKSNTRYEKTSSESQSELSHVKEDSNREQARLRDEIAALRQSQDVMWTELARCREESSAAAIREGQLIARIDVLEHKLNERLAPVDGDSPL